MYWHLTLEYRQTCLWAWCVISAGATCLWFEPNLEPSATYTPVQLIGRQIRYPNTKLGLTLLSVLTVVRQITTLLKILWLILFILTDIINIFLQRHLVVILNYFFYEMIGIIIWIILLSLRMIGDHVKVCFDAMQRKQKNVWFMPRFRCRDVCSIAYVTKNM